MSPQNHAAWLMAKQDTTHTVQDAPYHPPLPNELVIKNFAIAFNPADVLLQKLGIMIDVYPAILGCDVAGTVVEIGSDINDFKLGDRVIGSAKPLPGGVYKYSGFQEYVVLKMPFVAKIPDSVAFTDAVVLPLGILASSTCLFHESTLGLELPPGTGEKGTLVVWGASSSVGSCGVQLAVAAGYEVLGVAGQRNHQYVKSLGASQVIDQGDADVVKEIVAALEGKHCVGAFDAISKPETLHALCDILHESGGRKVIAAIKPGAEALAKNDVVIKTNFGARDFETTGALHLWHEFLEPALAAGSFQFKPQAEIVGHGLEDVQKGIDLLAQGVSAKKLVISL
ncbi:Dehydrogenase orsE [Lachnellula suecica]|uniref:Dehydrogenase orsE n=1 Tax=Lachnellula suecica TaxID=602035 RepID=A0A8T9C3H3_9HELO|nr:Dehydrogenase orsE [Lachnellula suecica]